MKAMVQQKLRVSQISEKQVKHEKQQALQLQITYPLKMKKPRNYLHPLQ